VAVGAFCKLLLTELGIRIYSHVISIRSVRISPELLDSVSVDLIPLIESSALRCCDPALDESMKAAVDDAIERGDTLGGTFEVRAAGVPPGLGSHVHWDRKLDGRLAQALMSINAIKAVETGSGLDQAPLGSEFHDEIFYDDQEREFYRKTNRAGGIEGGTSNGQEIIVRAMVKPIATLKRPLMSVNLETKQPFKAQYERSDTCVVPAAGVVGEAMVAIVLAQAVQEKFGGDTLSELKHNLASYRQRVREM
jgi:chorismate synthase